MEEKKLTRIGLWSLIKFNTLTFFIIEVIIGVVGLIVWQLKGNALPINPNIQLNTPWALLSILIYIPTAAMLSGIVYSAIVILPFNLILKIIKGLKIKASWV